MTRLHIKLSKLQPGVSVPPLPTGQVHTLVLRRKIAAMLEVDETNFRSKSSSLPPHHPDDDPRNPTRHGGIDLVATALSYSDAHPTKKILVAGHADTSGRNEYNTPLSENRADVVLFAIVGERDGFGTAADGPHLKSKEEKLEVQRKDRIQVLEWVAVRFGWPTSLAQNRGDYFSAVGSLQKSWNENGKAGNPTAPDLKVDRDFGPATWRAVFDCYQFEIAGLLEIELAEHRRRQQVLAADSKRWLTVKRVGCGEHQPIDNPGRDNYKSQTNRRVEVLFFDPEEEPTTPCLSGTCQPELCELFDKKFYHRVPIPHDPRMGKLIVGATNDAISLLNGDLTLTLSGPTISTQTLTLADAWPDDQTQRFTFDEFDKLATSTLRASSNDKQIVVWSNQLVTAATQPTYDLNLHALVEAATVDEGPTPPPVPGFEPEEAPD